MTNQALRTAVEVWSIDRETTTALYGHISQWDTSRVTSFQSLFAEKTDFNVRACVRAGAGACACLCVHA